MITQGYEMPVWENVQVYVAPSDSWLSGSDAVTSAISSGLELTVFFDRAADVGGQIRIIHLDNK